MVESALVCLLIVLCYASYLSLPHIPRRGPLDLLTSRSHHQHHSASEALPRIIIVRLAASSAHEGGELDGGVAGGDGLSGDTGSGGREGEDELKGGGMGEPNLCHRAFNAQDFMWDGSLSMPSLVGFGFNTHVGHISVVRRSHAASVIRLLCALLSWVLRWRGTIEWRYSVSCPSAS